MAVVENPSAPLRRIAFALCACLVALPAQSPAAVMTGSQGLMVTLDGASGRYEVRTGENWVFAGKLAGGASDVQAREGSDALGAYHELSFTWTEQVTLTGSIRAYLTRPALLFSATAKQALSDGAAMSFPRFTTVPAHLHGFSYQNHEFAPASFTLEENATPWLLYDERGHAAILSPAANYMIASMHGDGKSEIAGGLNRAVATLPAGFRHATLLVAGDGVNATWDAWGGALTTMEQVHRPANDADTGLRYLGYWTDNGAEYYYNYDPQLGYAGTLTALVQRYRAEGIPIRYLQLDSWWYYKSFTDPSGTSGGAKNPRLPQGEWNRYGGLLRYQAHPALFPRGLPAFQHDIGLPLITHNRWIDPHSPDHARYRISGFAALDPAWWHELMGYLASAGVVTYEQDWLNVIYEHSPQLAATPEAGNAFADGMARAAQDAGLTLQYCMPLPRHFLEGARYPNLTTIRVSGDRFGRERWDTFLYTTRLASALGIWPWSDVFMSGETDNLLLATLSAGMIGIGDRMGAEQRTSLLRAVRADGVIVKPDTPLVPIDAMYSVAPTAPMIAAAHSTHGGTRTSYVFAYSRSARPAHAEFTPAQVGVVRDAYLYDDRNHSARRLKARDPFDFELAPGASAYFVLVPVGSGGVALFGDAARFVPDGAKRIGALTDDGAQVSVTISFAPQERSVRLFGYAARRPSVTAQSGSVGTVSFDARSGRFEVEAAPGPERELEPPGNDPVQRAIVSVRAE